MHQFLYEFLSNKMCTDMTHYIKGYLLGDVVEKMEMKPEYDEDMILRRKNRWRKYSL